MEWRGTSLMRRGRLAVSGTPGSAAHPPGPGARRRTGTPPECRQLSLETVTLPSGGGRARPGLQAVALADDVALDLAGAAVDGGDHGRAQMAFHVVLRRIAVAA